ncbi:MAG TPA: ECF-type sigma factor [Phycisphaerales bacterium]|nr:ECF-type sigma factor [Phycisphaerales bacterium]HMP37622.1 ECF-type sigma factor [Phycisphaerales bacterium]
MEPTHPTHSITELLQAVREERPGAEDRLFERVYAELKAMARGIVADDSAGRREGATAVVNEAFARLAEAEFESRRHLFGAYANVMRQVLVDHARRRRALRRGGGREDRPLDEARDHPDRHDQGADRRPAELDAVAIDAMIPRLEAISRAEADVIRLRFFGGVPQRAIGELLGCDERTVRRYLSRAIDRMRRWAAESDRSG